VRTWSRAKSAAPAGPHGAECLGYVTARRAATVSSKVTGKVVELLIEEGMKVKAGQVVARLDDTNVKTSLDVARPSWNRRRRQSRKPRTAQAGGI